MPFPRWPSWYDDRSGGNNLRIDRLLWFLRLARTRSIAQDMAEGGHMRLNGRRVEKAHQKVAVGDVITLPRPHGALAIELVCLPSRRGPAQEAQSCYRVLDEKANNPIAAANRNEA